MNDHEIIQEFLNATKNKNDNINCSVKSIIAQFIIETRMAIITCAAKREWISNLELLDIEISALRNAIIDLESIKSTIEKGVTLQ